MIDDIDVEILAVAYHRTACPHKGLAMHSCRYRDAHRRTMAAVVAEYRHRVETQGAIG